MFTTFAASVYKQVAVGTGTAVPCGRSLSLVKLRSVPSPVCFVLPCAQACEHECVVFDKGLPPVSQSGSQNEAGAGGICLCRVGSGGVAFTGAHVRLSWWPCPAASSCAPRQPVAVTPAPHCPKGQNRWKPLQRGATPMSDMGYRRLAPGS